MGNFFVSTCLFLLTASGVVGASEKLSPQETFFLRRMNEFWKDRDFALVKKQILDFLTTHPQSGIHDNLYAILADIYYQERDYPKALEHYEKITTAALQQKSLTRKCQCLYLMEKFDPVIATLTPILSDETAKLDFKQEMQFVLADSLYRKMKTLDSTDEQKNLVTQAKPLLVGLYETTYKDKVLLPLAEVHRVLGDNPAATSLLNIIAEKMPEKKEEILLQIASLQMNYNRSGALFVFW